MDEEYLRNQPSPIKSPTAGTNLEELENISLLHSQEKGLHDAKGKSVAPTLDTAAGPTARPSEDGDHLLSQSGGTGRKGRAFTGLTRS